MKLPLLSLLLLPLSCFAQYRPAYTPAPVRPGPSPYQTSQQFQQQTRQNFNRMQAQQTQQAMQRQLIQLQYQRSQNQQQLVMQQMLLSQRTPEQLAKDRERQQEKEQKAEEQIQQLVQQPAAPKALNEAKVKAYKEVFLPGQLTAALQTMSFSPENQQRLATITENVRDKDWWGKQPAAQLPATLAEYGTTLATLTSSLLEFDVASPPAAPASVADDRIQALFAGESFDRAAAGQLIREAAQAEKIVAGTKLAQAVQSFRTLTASLAASPSPQPTPQQMQQQVKASLKQVMKQQQQYQMLAGGAGPLFQTQKSLRKSAAKYLAEKD